CLGPAFESAPWTRRRTALRALQPAGHPDAERLASLAESVSISGELHDALERRLGAIEAMLPPDPRLEDEIRSLDCDAIVLLSRCAREGPDRDVVKIARRLGIPSAMLVWSWDNLSSKAVLTEHP